MARSAHRRHTDGELPMTFFRRSRFRDLLLLAGAVLTAGCGAPQPRQTPFSRRKRPGDRANPTAGRPDRHGRRRSSRSAFAAGRRTHRFRRPAADSATDEPADDGPAAAAKARAFDWGTLDSDAPLDVTGDDAGSAPPLAGPAELEPYMPPPLVADANLSEPDSAPPVEWPGTAAIPSAGGRRSRAGHRRAAPRRSPRHSAPPRWTPWPGGPTPWCDADFDWPSVGGVLGRANFFEASGADRPLARHGARDAGI